MAHKLCSTIIFFIGTVFTTLQISECSSGTVSIEISPNNVTEAVGFVEITCTTKNGSDALMLQIVDEGRKNLVFIRDRSRVSARRTLPKRFKAEGSVFKKAAYNFLRLNISSPLVEDSGRYTCVIYHLDQAGFMKKERVSAKLNVFEKAPSTTAATMTDTTTTTSPSSTTSTTSYDGNTTSIPSNNITTTSSSSSITEDSILDNLLDRLVQVEMGGKTQPYWIIGMTEQERQILMDSVRGHKKGNPFNKKSDEVKALTNRLARLEALVFNQIASSNYGN